MPILICGGNGRVGNNQSVWKAETLNARGQLEKQTFGNGLITQRTYDALTGHVQTIKTGATANPQGVQELGYRFDPLGNLLERRKGALTETFSYDSLNRLIKATVNGGQSLTMSYDELGNITSKSDVGNYTYGQSAGPHAVTQAGTLSYTYDVVGNRISASNGQQIQYTSFNKPSRITQGQTTLEFLYSPSYDRYQQVITQAGVTKTIAYLGRLYEQETQDNVTEHKHTIFAGDESVAVYTFSENGQEKTRWLHHDHLGSVETTTDEQGQRVETLSFDAWGQRRSETWDVLTPEEIETLVATLDLRRGFTDHEHLDEVNLINMNGRIYDPMIGRFLSADPFIQFPEFTQSLNRYSYVLNNPLSFTDPSGFFSFKKFFRGVEKFFSDHWKEIVAIAAGALLGAVTGGLGGVLFGTLGYAIFSGAGFGFGSAFAGTLLNGGSVGQAVRAGLKAGIISGVTAGLTFGVGHVFFEGLPGIAGYATKVLAHGVVQGFASMAQGGKFEHGFLAGMFGKLGERLGPIGSIVAAGTASELGGGKFLNGAVSGAFVYLFNGIGDTIPGVSRVLVSFVTGQGPVEFYFGPNSPLTKDLMYAPKVNQARDYFYKKMATVTDYAGGFGPIEFWNATFPLSLTRHFVGSYDVNIRQVNDRLQFTVTNVTSLSSLFGSRYTHIPIPEPTTGPGRSVRQTYTWTEPMRTPYIWELLDRNAK